VSKPRIDPETGKPALTPRENKMVDGFVASGGNATREEVLDAISDVRHEAARYFYLLPKPKEAGSNG
jgi:hypothetical protein